MKKLMLHAKYPLINNRGFIEITVTKPRPDPESHYGDHVCTYKISAPDFEKKFDIYGIDPMQCTWLALRQIQKELSHLEKETNMKPEYCYFQSFEK